METKLVAALAEVVAGGRVNVSALCAELGISRKHYYALKRRFEGGGAEAVLARKSRRPRRSPGQVSAPVEDQIVRLRKELSEQGWDAGARTIRVMLAREGLALLPAASTIHRVLRRRGLVVGQPAKRPHSTLIRFEYDAPNACWQLDGTTTRLADGTVVCVLDLLDDHSRKKMQLLAASGETTDAAWACVEQGIARHGLPARMLTDRGTALNGHPDRQSVFRDRLRRLGVQPVSSRGYHPQTCGKNERSHQTLHRWLAARPAAHALTELQGLLEEFTDEFNGWRPHQALGGLTPDDRYAARPKTGPLGALETTRTTVTHVLVSARGEIRTGHFRVQVGREWQGARVTVLRDDLNVVVLHDREVVRRLVLDPDRRYQPNGRAKPPSPKPHRRRVLPMS
jgi:transposase InsO family protein